MFAELDKLLSCAYFKSLVPGRLHSMLLESVKLATIKKKQKATQYNHIFPRLQIKFYLAVINQLFLIFTMVHTVNKTSCRTPCLAQSCHQK